MVDGWAGDVCDWNFTVTQGQFGAPPVTPPLIAGPTSICPGGIATYTVTSMNASLFTWTVDPPATILSGQGTETITVDFSGATAPGPINVCVTVANLCDNSSRTRLYTRSYNSSSGNKYRHCGLSLTASLLYGMLCQYSVLAKQR